MMGYGNYGWNNMMGLGNGFSILPSLIQVVVFVDLVLVGVFLWKRIRKS